MDSASSNCHTVGVGFVSDIDHMGLALGVKVGKGVHAVEMDE
jgi:hypothetical protein